MNTTERHEMLDTAIAAWAINRPGQLFSVSTISDFVAFIESRRGPLHTLARPVREVAEEYGVEKWHDRTIMDLLVFSYHVAHGRTRQAWICTD